VTGLNIQLLVEELGMHWVIVGAVVMSLFAAWVMFFYKGRAPVDDLAEAA